MITINEKAKIDQVKIYEAEIPYKVPFQISGGISYTRKSLIIEYRSGDIIAYGESAPFEAPFYSSETISSAKAVLTEWLVPRVEGKEFQSIEELNEVLSVGIRGNNFAKAGLETAYWDLIAKQNNLSIKELIRYKLIQYGTTEEYLQEKDYVLSGVSVGIPADNSYKTLAKWIEDYVEEGYQRIKIKIKPGWEIKAARTAREVIGSDFPFWCDANSSFTLEKHFDILKGLDEFNALFLEQPLHNDDIFDHAKLAKMITTPICFDESLKGLKSAKEALETGASKIWNIKLQRMGGLLEGVKVYAFASQNNVAVWGGTMPESGIGAISILALATFAGFKYPADVEASARWYGPNLDLVEIEMDKEGKIYCPKGLGIGDIDLEKLSKCKVVY